MAKQIFNTGDTYSTWTLTKRILNGGNGSVWTTQNADSEVKVIKLLKKDHATARTRFKDEMSIMSKNNDIPGVMQIIDMCDPEGGTLWYVMEKGIVLQEHLNEATSSTIVEAILEIAKVLSLLHSRGVSHRDIKPQNLFFVNGRFTIGDFGLVDYPTKEEGLTLGGSALGPRWTIAPEMRNSPEDSDGIKADVYSLAKTLWILLTGVWKGFEGQYSPTGSIGLIHYQSTMYLSVIEDLLVVSTENNPNLRPSIDKFIETLTYWLTCQNDFFEKNKLDWQLIQQKLFPTVMPQRVIWEDPVSIVSILNIVGGIDNLNHVFFPTSGGMDLEGAKISNEENCIEINFGLIYIVKPLRLIFESFNSDFEWNYFRLEASKLDPIYKTSRAEEEVTETSPGVYNKYDYADNYYDEHGEWPENARHVTRVLNGSFVMFQKTSSYNYTPETYDGRHNKVDMDDFKAYIQKVINQGYKIEIVTDKDGKYVGERKKNGPMPHI